ENRWRFHPTGAQTCIVEFFIAYEFKSRALGLLMGATFDTAFRLFASAFERRADQIYPRQAAQAGGRRSFVLRELAEHGKRLPDRRPADLRSSDIAELALGMDELPRARGCCEMDKTQRFARARALRSRNARV